MNLQQILCWIWRSHAAKIKPADLDNMQPPAASLQQLAADLQIIKQNLSYVTTFTVSHNAAIKQIFSVCISLVYSIFISLWLVQREQSVLQNCCRPPAFSQISAETFSLVKPKCCERFQIEIVGIWSRRKKPCWRRIVDHRGQWLDLRNLDFLTWPLKRFSHSQNYFPTLKELIDDIALHCFDLRNRFDVYFLSFHFDDTIRWRAASVYNDGVHFCTFCIFMDLIMDSIYQWVLRSSENKKGDNSATSAEIL